MKKLSVLLLFVLTLVFTGCKNDNTVNPKTALGKATITGTVYADLNLSTVGKEKVANITVVARVFAKDLILNPSLDVTYGYKYYQATTDANGKYSLDVETNVNKTNISVDVIPQDFEFLVVQGDGTTTKSTQFIGAGAKKTVSVYNGGTFLQDITF
jgi:hypothetical protein